MFWYLALLYIQESDSHPSPKTMFTNKCVLFKSHSASFPQKNRMPHKHPSENFSPVVASRSFLARIMGVSLVQGRSHLSDASGRTWYRKMVLRPMLEQRYKAEGEPEGGLWGWALDSSLQ